MKLSAFLEINPFVPSEQIFVDDYSLEAYNAMGFGELEMGMELPEGFKLQPPPLGLGGWWKYLSNVANVSPVPSETVTKEQVIQAVSKLSGTFVVNGKDVVYQWNDVIPGDTADLGEVMAAIREA
mmetsp:Transcript_2723/g.7587  ORF Transcript_2723/g.7587 Transcript_2723/m.7587 type:complete len:125 (-) Transcript_2723:561-935(-)